MLRKKIIYGIITFLTFLIGKKVFQKKQQTTVFFDPAQYHGTWVFVDENCQTQQLLITPTFDVSINGHSLTSTLVELNKQRFVFRDQYGFYLTLSYSDQTFYDESTDRVYPITKKKENINEKIYKISDSEKSTSN